MSIVIQTILPVFLIVLTGYAIGRRKRINIQILIDLIIYLASPCLIFSSISRSDINLTDFFTITCSAVAIILTLAFFTFFILKLKKSKKVGVYLPLSIGNTGNLGYPIALFAFGAAGLSRAIVYDMMSSLFIFSLGIYIVHRKNDIKEAFKIPLIYAVIFGLMFNLLKIPVPEIIFKPIEIIGMITIPLALLILGYKLTEIKVSSMKIALLASLFKIIGGFIMAVIIINLFSITGLVRDVIILQASMPSAVMSMILTAKYKRDASLVASIVFLTTVISAFSIPLILWFLTWY
ncbi:MAG: AEC family transporter [Nanoarchaeota archaeon]